MKNPHRYLNSAHKTRFLGQLPTDLQNKALEIAETSLLPNLPNTTRGIPNICLGSALFGLIQRGKRRAVKNQIIAAVKGLDIRYTGWQLDQGALDVLVQALHLQKNDSKSDEYIRFNAKDFLRSIGRQSGKSGREWLKDSFRRLTATALEINVEIKHTHSTETFSYVGSLVEEFYYNNRQQSYFLALNQRISSLFNAGWTQLQWQQRHQLHTDLAKWLHGFFASHKTPYPIKVTTLKHLCGSGYGRLSDFRGKLCLAMDELQATNVLSSWKIDMEDKVYVQRPDRMGGIAVVTGGA